jgi:hypothetical protein
MRIRRELGWGRGPVVMACVMRRCGGASDDRSGMVEGGSSCGARACVLIAWVGVRVGSVCVSV